MTPKKAPPLVYHSNQIKALNGVDDIQEKYLYNAAIKMDEQLEYFITPNIERLKAILHEVKKAEHGDKQTSNLIVELISKLVDGSVLESMKMNKKTNLSRGLQVYNTFADSAKLVQSYNNTFTSAQKVIGEYWLNVDLMLLLSSKIAYSMFRQCNNTSGIKLPRLSNPPSSSNQAIDISLNNEELQLALNSMLEYCLNLWSTRKSFSKIFIEKLETQRLKICDTNLKAVLHQRKKDAKNAKTHLNEVKTSSLDDSIELYNLASFVKNAGKSKPIRVASAEIENLQEGIKNGRSICDEKRALIEASLQANKESVIKNAELEFVEKENKRSAAVLNSSLYTTQLLLLPKLEREKLHWKDAQTQQLQQLKCSVLNAYLKNSEFRRKMILIFQQFPQSLQQARSAIENAVDQNVGLIGQISRRKVARFQSTQKCRSQWSQHYDVIDIALNDASSVEDAGLSMKENMIANIQKEFEELKAFSDISMTIPFELPARLIPPFPQNEARLLPNIPIRLIDKKIIDIIPYRLASSASKRAISISPSIPVEKESPTVAVPESSKRIAPLEDFETIEGCTSSGIKYTIRAERSSGKSSRMSVLDDRQQRKRKRTETPEYYREERRRTPEYRKEDDHSRDRRRSPDYYRDDKRERRRSPEYPRDEKRERRGRISEMYERDYGRSERSYSRNDQDYDRKDKDYDRKDYGRSERDYDRKDYGRSDKDYSKNDRDYDRKDYGRSSRNDDRYSRDYDKREKHYDRYEKDYGKYDKDYDRYDRDSSRGSSLVSIKRRRRDSDETPRKSRRVTPDHDPSPRPCDNPIDISSELEGDTISDADDGISPSSSSASNVSKSLLLTNISDFVYPKAGKITIEEMPRKLADLFKHVLLPEQLQRPLAFPAEQENLRNLIQWLDSKKLKLSDDKKKLLERLILKHFIQYCRAEQEHILLCGASEDYLDYRVYPVEIVREIYHNVKEGEAAFNELRQLRNAEQKMSKAKTSSAVGFAKLLFGCTKELEDLFNFEEQELSCISNRAKKENSIRFSSEYLNHLRELRSHLHDYCSSVGIMESKQTDIKDILNKWKEMLDEQIRINEKRKECYAAAKAKLSASIEEKKKKLAELKEQSQKLTENRITSTIKAHENTVSLSKVKISYNQLLDKIGRADNAGDQIDVISEHLFKHYKELLSCPTCKVNPKNCALTKCYHLFCEECITKMFKTRNRKCPECNTRVGPNDYHRVYF
uniref:E3 ubiquitin protein ligase n=1 Tax=Panagrolaimus sp. ES5 TaxID=591445 RepID=A0AC34F3R6_9BILA